MSWIHKLYETYEAAQGNSLLDNEGRRPLPVGHIFAAVHIEVTLNAAGDFVAARVIDKTEAQTCIPCTVHSGSRSGSKPPPHPLADKLQYVAGDFRAFSGKVTRGFLKTPDQPHKDYVDGLRRWVEAFPHPKLKAILAYTEKGCLIADLRNKAPRVIPFSQDGKFLLKADRKDKEQWPIWKAVGSERTPQDAVVRWQIELSPGDPNVGTWDDPDLLQGWSEYYPSLLPSGLCMVTGKSVPLTSKHPRGIRNSADGAKLISSNDEGGFTFRGRFTDKEGAQACVVGYEASEKAHSALRWLIGHQGFRHGDQVFVAWAVSGKDIPAPFGGLDDWKSWDDDAPEEVALIPEEATTDHSRDLGQIYARRLNKFMAGYGDIDDPSEDIVIMGLDSATTGRMAITYYRELKGSEFLQRLRNWHSALAWPQTYFPKPQEDKKTKSIPIITTAFAPSPQAIAEAAWGGREEADADNTKKKRSQSDDKAIAATIERLIPCIIDGTPIPNDIVVSCFRKAAKHPQTTKKAPLYRWEATLDVACAVFKGSQLRLEKDEYAMSLETERTSRDYLFGRLLAVAENIEQMALKNADENRPTNAARLFQRFADHPASTWRRLELALLPYKKRLQNNDTGFLVKREKLLNEIVDQFRPDDFIGDSPLGPEFLLGYRCQTRALLKKSEAATNAEGDKE
ncbi:type I-C CRISPR-associated protein Cas8c/Csd1 [Oleispirillum naphthae]|uniref:type I-C CRISPR-associated protein Cas8c/Csd1 n=1 Tax=Oleispirillum naphthae TaxID=2838853 RepID=UPI003082415F